MSDWDEFDFAITHVKKDPDGNVKSLRGHVVEDGNIRDLPIDLTVPKAIEYLGYDGVFCTAVKDNDEFVLGAEVTVDDRGDEPRLHTDEDASDEYKLTNLPTY